MGQWPRIHESRELWMSYFSAKAQSLEQYFFQTFHLLYSCHCLSTTSEAVICTQGYGGELKLPHRGLLPRSNPLLMVWDCCWPDPPDVTNTSADSICLVQSGGGPFVYLSMGWNDRAKLLERAQL